MFVFISQIAIISVPNRDITSPTLLHPMLTFPQFSAVGIPLSGHAQFGNTLLLLFAISFASAFKIVLLLSCGHVFDVAKQKKKENTKMHRKCIVLGKVFDFPKRCLFSKTSLCKADVVQKTAK